MRKAEYCKNEKGTSSCYLCPNLCVLKENELGKCLSRKRQNGILCLNSYGEVVASGIDPIEKKPLYHVEPGKPILSIGSFGCNFSCRFCQNYNISQAEQPSKKLLPDELVQYALSIQDNIGVAFTYNEPSIWFEYIMDVAPILKGNALLTVMVTNGYLSSAPWNELCEVVDAMNIDLKAFNPSFYKNICSGNLDIVKRNIKTAVEKGVHVELTNLVVTGLNDSEIEFEEMILWVSELSKDIPFHISRYFPQYKETSEPTSLETLKKFYEIANQHLNYVYLGNVVGNSNTSCPKCGKVWIERAQYLTTVINNSNSCECGSPIPFIYKAKVESGTSS